MKELSEQGVEGVYSQWRDQFLNTASQGPPDHTIADIIGANKAKDTRADNHLHVLSHFVILILAFQIYY